MNGQTSSRYVPGLYAGRVTVCWSTYCGDCLPQRGPVVAVYDARYVRRMVIPPPRPIAYEAVVRPQRAPRRRVVPTLVTFEHAASRARVFGEEAA